MLASVVQLGFTGVCGGQQAGISNHRTPGAAWQGCTMLGSLGKMVLEVHASVVWAIMMLAARLWVGVAVNAHQAAPVTTRPPLTKQPGCASVPAAVSSRDSDGFHDPWLQLQGTPQGLHSTAQHTAQITAHITAQITAQPIALITAGTALHMPSQHSTSRSARLFQGTVCHTVPPCMPAQRRAMKGLGSCSLTAQVSSSSTGWLASQGISTAPAASCRTASDTEKASGS